MSSAWDTGRGPNSFAVLFDTPKMQPFFRSCIRRVSQEEVDDSESGYLRCFYENGAIIISTRKEKNTMKGRNKLVVRTFGIAAMIIVLGSTHSVVRASDNQHLTGT